jgi:DNA-binding protein HU-beta
LLIIRFFQYSFLILRVGYKFALPKNFSTLKYNTVTKADIINEIAEKTGVDKADVTASVEAFFSVVKTSMSNGNNIYIRGFGSFINKKRKKKIARNISRNTALVIEEHFVPSFKPAKIFVNKIKNSDKVKQLQEK